MEQTEVTLRPATRADRTTIKALVRSEALNPLGLKWQQFVVAEVDNEIVGCAQVRIHRGQIREFASLMVLRPWRNKGIARLLVNHFLQAHPAPLWLMCANRLVPFYEQFGFQNCLEPKRMPRRFRLIFRLSRLLGRQEIPLAIMTHIPDLQKYYLINERLG